MSIPKNMWEGSTANTHTTFSPCLRKREHLRKKDTIPLTLTLACLLGWLLIYINNNKQSYIYIYLYTIYIWLLERKRENLTVFHITFTFTLANPKLHLPFFLYDAHVILLWFPWNGRSRIFWLTRLDWKKSRKEEEKYE